MTQGMTGAFTPMPRYQCHKKVWALKIKEVSLVFPKLGPGGACYLVPEEKMFSTLVVSSEYVAKHNPQASGYFVVYEDGYQSYSPANAFEEGYTRIG